jgi:hypothetical protein
MNSQTAATQSSVSDQYCHSAEARENDHCDLPAACEHDRRYSLWTGVLLAMWRTVQHHKEERQSCTCRALLLAREPLQIVDACTIELGRSSIGRHATDNNFGSAIRSTIITSIRAFKRSMKLSRVQGAGLVRLVFFPKANLQGREDKAILQTGRGQSDSSRAIFRLSDRERMVNRALDLRNLPPSSPSKNNQKTKENAPEHRQKDGRAAGSVIRAIYLVGANGRS